MPPSRGPATEAPDHLLQRPPRALRVPRRGQEEHPRLRVEQGGFLFVDACCGDREFDRGFRLLIQEIFPPPEYELRPLAPEHPVWRARPPSSLPEVHPLWGIEHGCRTVAIYSPRDLSCFWNQMENRESQANPAVIAATKIGQNVVDYATGREMPADKLVAREVHNLPTGRGTQAGRAADRQAETHRRLEHRAPRRSPTSHGRPAQAAVPVSMSTSASGTSSPATPSWILLPATIYIHGRGAHSFPREDLEASLRHHLEPGGGLPSSPDAACAAVFRTFDAAFRRFAAELLPNHRLEPIPRTDEIYNLDGGFELKECQFNKAAGGGKDFPQLEGVKINGHWAIIYSRLDLGCALERHSGIDCKGYTFESAVRIAANIVLYSTLP